ncbi:Phenylalanine N-monooxygenase [Citrus sinensis]|uniref:Phenylalanine N-monooxygenase n=1 Tax=Citrus sinensis TaxID=2711 RepID=A0ACB8LBZ3_CITSI|nr:Phenylalanine N-monooxygenase [Citrus sinensis]
MNKERLLYRFVQREKLTNPSPALTFLSPSRLPACLTSFSPSRFPLATPASVSLTVPEAPSRFRLSSPASLSLTLPEAPSRLPACLTNFSLPHAFGLPHQLLSPLRFQKLPHGFRRASPASLSLPLPEAPSRLPACLTLPDPSRSLTKRLLASCSSSSEGSEKKIKRLPLPPGPSPWPIVGNLPEMWRKKPAFNWIHDVMKELNTDIACIRLGNVHVIPVTSPEIALEVLKDNDSVFATRPLTMGTEYSSRGFLSIAVVPLGQQWKKMRKVVASHVLCSARLHSLLFKRREEADNLVRFVYSQCCKSGSGSAVNVRHAARQYCGNVMRNMMFNRGYFGEGNEDGGPGFEEEEHVESLFIVLQYLYAFTLSDYLPWMRVFDLEGREKLISNAIRTVSKYHDPIIEERIQQRRHHRGNYKKESDDHQDLLDVLISAKDESARPSLSVDEIKAQCMDLMLATVDNPSNAVEWALGEMINQPEIIKRATEEVDMVVGKERLVQEYDIPQLNYVKACLREALRLHPVAPFNLPESPATSFPKAATGRRGCMGAALGSEMSVILLARLLQGFDWSLPSNEEKIDLAESKYDLLMAKPMHASAKPRLAAELYT